MEPLVPGWFVLRVILVTMAGSFPGQRAVVVPAAKNASGALVVQIASNGIERVRIAHPLHGWSTTVPVVPGKPIRLQGLFPGEYVVEGWVSGIVAGKSVNVAAGAPAVVELKECWIAPDPPEDEGERVSRRYGSEPRPERSVRPRSVQQRSERHKDSTERGSSSGSPSAAPAVGSTAGTLEDLMLANCRTCVLLSAFDAETGAAIATIELRNEDRMRLFGSNVTEIETPVALPSTSFDPVVWAWRPWSVWWVRAPGYAWQRVTIDHSADGGSVAVGLVRVDATKKPPK